MRPVAPAPPADRGPVALIMQRVMTYALDRKSPAGLN